MKKILSLMVTLCMLMMCIMVPMVASAEDVNYALATNGATITTGCEAIINGDKADGVYIGPSSSFEVAFEDYVEISSINFYVQSVGYAHYGYAYSLDGVTWTDLVRNSNCTNDAYTGYHHIVPSGSAVAKYIKITNMNATSRRYINELEVYGKTVASPYLKSLTSDAGTWTAAFAQETTSYKVQVDDLQSLPTLSYEPLMANATVQYTEASAANNYTATIAVTHGGETTNYTVQFILYNYALASNGTTITAGCETIINGNTADGVYIGPSGSFEVAFENYVEISSFYLYVETTGYGHYGYEYSLDGVTWTGLVKNSNCTNDAYTGYHHIVPSGSAVAKYIKITNISTSRRYMKELEVYGTEITGFPYLKSLSSAAGTWSTAFAQNTTSYKVQVDSLDSLPQLTYAPLMADAEVVYTEASADNNYTATIVVTHGGETTTYTVQFVLYNWALPVNGTIISGTSDAAGIADGDLNTYCYLKNATPVTMTLADYTSIDSIRFYSGSRVADQYELSYSLDGTAWTKLVHSENCTVIRSTEANWLTYETYIPVTAKYVKIARVATTGTGFVINEFEISGSKVEESYTANCAVLGNQVIANVTFLNNTQAAETDKYYLMAVYVGEEIHEIIPVNKASVSVGAGVAVSTDFATTKELPEDADVTARLFVWSDPATIVPVRTPIDVL